MYVVILHPRKWNKGVDSTMKRTQNEVNWTASILFYIVVRGNKNGFRFLRCVWLFSRLLQMINKEKWNGKEFLWFWAIRKRRNCEYNNTKCDNKKKQVKIHKEDGDFFCFIQMFDNIIWGCKCYVLSAVQYQKHSQRSELHSNASQLLFLNSANSKCCCITIISKVFTHWNLKLYSCIEVTRWIPSENTYICHSIEFLSV